MYRDLLRQSEYWICPQCPGDSVPCSSFSYGNGLPGAINKPDLSLSEMMDPLAMDADSCCILSIAFFGINAGRISNAQVTFDALQPTTPPTTTTESQCLSCQQQILRGGVHPLVPKSGKRS
jgi:hypothetical protein